MAPGLGCLLILLGLAGCINLDPSVDPTRTFLLHAPGVDIDGWTADGQALSIYVERVEIPPYLDDRRLVLRLSDEQVDYQEFVRWAEPLDQGIARALALNLLDLPGVDEVGYYPWQGPREADLKLRMKVFKFEKHRNQAVEFNGMIEIQSSAESGSAVLLKFPFEVRQDIAGNDPEAIIRAMSQAIRELTRRMAQAYRQADAREIYSGLDEIQASP